MKDPERAALKCACGAWHVAPVAPFSGGFVVDVNAANANATCCTAPALSLLIVRPKDHSAQ